MQKKNIVNSKLLHAALLIVHAVQQYAAQARKA